MVEDVSRDAALFDVSQKVGFRGESVCAVESVCHVKFFEGRVHSCSGPAQLARDGTHLKLCLSALWLGNVIDKIVAVRRPRQPNQRPRHPGFQLAWPCFGALSWL